MSIGGLVLEGNEVCDSELQCQWILKLFSVSDGIFFCPHTSSIKGQVPGRTGVIAQFCVCCCVSQTTRCVDTSLCQICCIKACAAELADQTSWPPHW